MTKLRILLNALNIGMLMEFTLYVNTQKALFIDNPIWFANLLALVAGIKRHIILLICNHNFSSCYMMLLRQETF